MRIFNYKKLEKFWQMHADSKNALQTWYQEVLISNWDNPQDIKNRYASVSFLDNNRVVFNIKGNHYRLVVVVEFKKKIVIIDFVGTHSEYEHEKFS